MKYSYALHGLFPQLLIDDVFDFNTGLNYAVIVNDEIWRKFNKKYNNRFFKKIYFIEKNDSNSIDKIINDMKHFNGVILGIGGGTIIDISKYISQITKNTLHIFPSATTTDAFLTPSSVIIDTKTGGEIIIKTKAPDVVFFDMDYLKKVDYRFNVAGLGDVISMYTASYDWKLAHLKNDEKFDSIVYYLARRLIDSLFEIKDEIKSNSKQGIKYIIDTIIFEFFIYNMVGNNRPEVGSEHFFARLIEENMQGDFLHGELVSLGVLIMSFFQNQDFIRIKSLLDLLGMRYSPADLGLNVEDVILLMTSLNKNVQKNNYPYTIINEITLNEKNLRVAFEKILG